MTTFRRLRILTRVLKALLSIVGATILLGEFLVMIRLPMYIRRGRRVVTLPKLRAASMTFTLLVRRLVSRRSMLRWAETLMLSAGLLSNSRPG